MDEAQIRGSKGAGWVALAIGIGALAVVSAVDFLRTPVVVLPAIVATLSALALLLDRRVKLSLSPEGIRYSGWSRDRIPWEELSAYRLQRWRGQPYLQLVPRRPSELVGSFSPVGRLNHAAARLLRMPSFSIGISQLEVSESALAERIAVHLPGLPADGSGRV